MSKSWTLEIQESPTGDQFIEFPPEALAEVGWEAGDTVEWIDNHDGTWSIKKKEPEKVWVMVECISTFRERYMVEAPADHPEFALDTVVCNEAKEFSQQHLGETIVSHRVVSQEEALRICDEDNNYCMTWTDNAKMGTFFTKEGEGRDY